MKINKLTHIAFFSVFIFYCCGGPVDRKEPKKTIKHNYIILLDLSDRLIENTDQSERDEKIIKTIYSAYEFKVKKSLYIRSKDKIKVVIANQMGSNLKAEDFENELYINMDQVPLRERKIKEPDRRTKFFSSLDELYKKAVFSKNPKDYYGANIWRYFDEDLENDISKDSLTENFVFVITDGYPVVGQSTELVPIKKNFRNVKVMLLEVSPRNADGEWEKLMTKWSNWFKSMDISNYYLEKRGALAKTEESISELLSSRIIAAHNESDDNSNSKETIESVKGSDNETQKAEETKAEQKIPVKQVKDQKSVSTHVEEERLPLPDYKSMNLEQKLNLLSNNKYNSASKKKLSNDILSQFASIESIVAVYFDNGNFSGNSFSISDYLDRLRLLERYKVALKSVKKDYGDKISSMEIIETTN